MADKIFKFMRKLIIPIILFAFLLVAPICNAAENYGACTYSSGDYSSTNSCDDAQPATQNNLSDTGDNQKQLIILAVSLIVGICGISGTVFLVKKYTKKSD